MSNNKSLKYTDVFNNPNNNYVCPTFPTCSNSNNDDYYFEFLDPKKAGIVNNISTIQSMDFSDISSYVKSWSQDTKVIQPKNSLFITGEEFCKQKKFIKYREVGSYPPRDNNKSYYLNIIFQFYDGVSFVPKSFLVPIYKTNFDIKLSCEFLKKYLDYKKIPLDIIYDTNIGDDTLEIFDTDNDGYVDVWWSGEKHVNASIKFISTDDNFKYYISQFKLVSNKLCDIYKDEDEFIIANGNILFLDKLDADIGDDLSAIIDAIDGDDKDKEANIYWVEFNGTQPTPNTLIPNKFDKDRPGDSGYGFVDVVWDGENDDVTDSCIFPIETYRIEENISYDITDENQFYKYLNGAFKGISMIINYPKVKDVYGNYIDRDDIYSYINYNILKEKFIDNNGNSTILHTSGMYYNVNEYVNYLNKNDGWESTSVMYINISNDYNLIPGMILYNPHPFPVAVTYIKFN